jgi:hypothetical protein
MEGKIINNKKILSEYWSSNTPNQCNALKNGILLAIKENITCGILIVQDINTKEIETYYGMTNYIDRVENRKMLLEIGNKLNTDDFINFINAVKKEK